MQFIFIVFFQCFLVSNSITPVDNTLVYHLAIRISDNQYSFKLLSESILINLIHWNVLSWNLVSCGFDIKDWAYVPKPFLSIVWMLFWKNMCSTACHALFKVLLQPWAVSNVG